MAIEKRWKDGEEVFTPVCDVCGDNLDDEWDFYDAVEAKKQAGWRSRKVGDDWIDMCPYCQKEEQEKQVMNDFAGLKGRF